MLEPAVSVSPSITVKPAIVDNQITAPTIAKTADDDIDWTHLAFNLGLQGLAQEIAVNSVVDAYDGNVMRLLMTPELKNLVNPGLETEIQQAIEAKLTVSCRLELLTQAELNVETPQQARVRELEEDRQRAIGEIRENEIVKKLGRAFGAELDESTVRKIEY